MRTTIKIISFRNLCGIFEQHFRQYNHVIYLYVYFGHAIILYELYI